MSPVNVNLSDLINQLVQDVPETDALARISEAQRRSHSLSDLGDQLVGHFVEQARTAGASWSQIGDAIGVSKQAAQQKWVAPTFERFTVRARHVVVLSQEQARAHSHDHILTEHILMGLLNETDGLAAKALEKLAGSSSTVREAVEGSFGPPGKKALKGHIPFSAEAKLALQFALQAALKLGHNYIGTEHILLGVLAVPEGKAAQTIAGLGITAEQVEEEIKAQLAGYLAAAAQAKAAEQAEKNESGEPTDPPAEQQ
ncbi:MAG TPA: Clp protease N-terminal domain-containing protein [Pseudonocardiaceae bacterium]|jgi:hypothetical protein|nr:Clp protease N-terminal domain-containing protein [Pseudonocardiaceae bacterium]